MANENTLEDVTTWLDRQGDTHFGANGKLYKAAILRFAERRVEREPDTVQWMSENLDTLAQRLAKADHMAPNSLKTYLSRAKSALGAYVDWSENPVGWSPNKKPASSGTSQQKRSAPQKPKANGESVVQTPPAAHQEKTLQDEISEALVAIARWPRLRPFLMKGLTEAMTDSEK